VVAGFAERILFSSNRHAPGSGEEDYPRLDVYVIDSDGSDLRRLTFTQTFGVNPWSARATWSPDGRAFAFQRHLSAAVLGLDRTGGRTICSARKGDVEFLPVAWTPPVPGLESRR
jgi:Tol biopolymer transport system component